MVDASSLDLSKLVTFEELLEEELKDPEFRAYWQKSKIARALSIFFVKYRITNKLTEQELADEIGISVLDVRDIEAVDFEITIFDEPDDEIEE